MHKKKRANLGVGLHVIVGIKEVWPLSAIDQEVFPLRCGAGAGG
jgi:hypothetical protein